ncbi:MAG: D-tyrosyl-tRNA(Tyr) deacylase [Anaerolineae bacterium CG_4_9_14_3_um_filter_57_17]|nr:D-tyrosyl-tRNA(Tyr) deacylase [bacterium]NCT21047.1 D-tyrosyl-tRNA(Tyr) deacylase [bacterium]OIO87482.1 MAG: D-tyrosyl-tRNA(Tyr) deacylase [Anaerolineae bacterium CG2_30_57_67]PJB66370.1 MAG: D-tyrosyl-tRNA(Tyr) deacylase [Anaerolineae bacterium CG_4_9_14_3_um_filter_57_17]
MRALLQRVTQAKVTVNHQVVGEIGPGLVVFIGVGHGDSETQAAWMAEKIANLRIFEDEAGKMNRSVREIGGAALVVSQFTLYANSEHGRRPSFIEAALPAVAAPLVETFANLLRQQGLPVQQGIFGADMLVEIHNDGPVTIWLER